MESSRLWSSRMSLCFREAVTVEHDPTRKRLCSVSTHGPLLKPKSWTRRTACHPINQSHQGPERGCPPRHAHAQPQNSSQSSSQSLPSRLNCIQFLPRSFMLHFSNHSPLFFSFNYSLSRGISFLGKYTQSFGLCINLLIMHLKLLLILLLLFTKVLKRVAFIFAFTFHLSLLILLQYCFCSQPLVEGTPFKSTI